MDKHSDSPATRREFLEGAARVAVLAVLAGLAVLLAIGRRREPRQGECRGNGACGGCPLSDDCLLRSGTHKEQTQGQ